MLGLTRKRPKRHRSKQVGVVEGKDGKRLRIMRYKLPELDYHTPDCAPKNVTHIDVEYLTMLLWQLAVDGFWWKRLLSFMDPGLPEQARGEFEVGGSWQGFSGQRLTSIITQDAGAGLLPMLMRAPFIDSDEDASKFLGHWMNEDGRRRMAIYARHVPQPRPSKKEEAALLHMLTEFGLQLRPSAPEDGSTAFRELSSLLEKSSGLFKSQRTKLPSAQEVQRELDERDCGCGTARHRSN